MSEGYQNQPSPTLKAFTNLDKLSSNTLHCVIVTAAAFSAFSHDLLFHNQVN